MRRSSGDRGSRLRRAAPGLSSVLVALAASMVPAAAATQELPAADPPPSLHTSFDHYWRRYIESITAGDADGAARMLEELRRLRVERNAFNLNDVGLSFVYQGFGHLDNGNREEARKHFDTARELAPDLPTAYWGLARAAEREGGFGYLTGLVHRLRAQLAALRSERNGPYASWNLLFLFFASAMGMIFVFALVLLYRYGALLYHDIEERFGDGLGQKGVLAATAGALLLPLIVTAGVGWLATYWLVVTFGYQSVRERAVSIASLLLLLAAAPFAELYAAWTRTVANPVYQAALSSITGTFDVGDVGVLQRALQDHPEDRDLRFLLAMQYKNLGDYDLAAREYLRILDADPSDLEARLNLGNIYFAQRDWDGALSQYNETLNTNGRLALAHYNKSLAHAENFQFAEREEARSRAERLDASAVAAHEKRTGDYRVVADARLDDAKILGKFYGLSEGVREEPVTSFLSPSVASGWGLRFIAAGLVLGALLFLLESLFKERRLTRRCWKCGSAFCGRCQIGTGRKGLCTQCYHLFFMKDGVSASARNDKLKQVQRASESRAMVFRVLSIVAPGAGHVSEGMPLVGVFFLFLWILGVSIFFVGNFYPLPDGLFGFSTGVSYVVPAAMGSVLVAANLVARPVTRG